VNRLVPITERGALPQETCVSVQPFLAGLCAQDSASCGLTIERTVHEG